MDEKEASKLARIINPKILIPIHYGSIVGDKKAAQELKNILTDTDIEVIEKIIF